MSKIEVLADRGLPANPDAERAILGAILLDNSIYFQAAERLQADHFSLDSHRRIYLRMSELSEMGKPIDYVTLPDILRQHKELEAVGGDAYVTDQLTRGMPRIKNISQYIKIVRDKASLRGLIHSCNRNMAAAYDQEESAQSMVARALDDLLQLQSGGTDEPKHVAEFSEQVTEKLKLAWSDPGGINRYSLVIPGINDKTGGMLPEEYGCIMGRTGDGKTGYACQIALENGLKGKPVLIFPLELSKEVMYRRLLCVLSRVTNRVLIKHTFEPTPKELERIAVAKQTLDRLPIYFDDSRELTGAQMVAKVRMWKRRHCEKDDDGLVIVDYLQKVLSKYREQRDKMTDISENARRVAKDERLRMLGLSQMGRPERKNMNTRPTKFDPKESGSIENDVHLLISAFRPVDEHNMPTGADELIICKQRDGESAIEEVEYRGDIYSFFSRSAALAARAGN